MDELLNTQQGQKEINQIKGGDDDVSYAGCTANVALIHTANPNTNNPKITLYVANSGDSRSVLCRQNGLEDGKPKYENFDMSVDHKPDNTEEKRRIEKAGGFVSDGRVNGNLNLSRALGDLEYKRDDKLKSHEQLIIAVPDVKE
jgi:protein phosphatase 1G